MNDESAIRQKPGYIDIQRLTFSAVALLYFVAVIAINQVKSTLLSGVYYMVLLLGVVVFFAAKRAVSLKPVLLYALAGVGLGICNLFTAGNITYLLVVILGLSFLMAILMIDDAVDERAFLIAMYLNAAVVLLRLLQRGGSASVYVDSSNNYVSIHLLAPGVLYYSLLEARGKKIPLLPAVVMWGLSLLAGGRGGLLACTILVAGIILHKYLENDATRRERVLLSGFLILIMIPVVLILLNVIFTRLTGLYAITRFLNRGMDGGGRLDCWIEYIGRTLEKPEWFFFGVPLNEVSWAVHYNGNLHNSFLFVHAYLGIGGFLFLLIMMGRALVMGIRRRKWVYVWCIITFAFRGMTDHMFGVNRITVVVLALIFLPDVLRRKEREKEREAAGDPDRAFLDNDFLKKDYFDNHFINA